MQIQQLYAARACSNYSWINDSISSFHFITLESSRGYSEGSFNCTWSKQLLVRRHFNFPLAASLQDIPALFHDEANLDTDFQTLDALRETLGTHHQDKECKYWKHIIVIHVLCVLNFYFAQTTYITCITHIQIYQQERI